MSYPFDVHARRCRAAAQAGEVLVTFVQVRSQGVTACGRLVDCWTSPDGVDLWRIALEPPFRRLSYYAPSKVRQCSGLDGRCLCAGEAGRVADSEAGRAPGFAGRASGLGGLTC